MKQRRQELKSRLKQEGFGKYSKKQWRMLESDDDQNDMNGMGLVSLGPSQPNNK